MGPVSKLLPFAMKTVLNKPITFRANGPLGPYTAHLGKGVIAEVFPGGSEGKTTVYVSKGDAALSKEIPECWLKNWQVIKAIKTDF